MEAVPQFSLVGGIGLMATAAARRQIPVHACSLVRTIAGAPGLAREIDEEGLNEIDDAHGSGQVRRCSAAERIGDVVICNRRLASGAAEQLSKAVGGIAAPHTFDQIAENKDLRRDIRKRLRQDRGLPGFHAQDERAALEQLAGKLDSSPSSDVDAPRRQDV